MRGALIVLVVLMTAGTAQAQASDTPPKASAEAGTQSDPRQVAQKHHEDGIKFFQEGRFDLARIEFLAAFELTKEPDLLYNAAVCYERMGQKEKHAELLETYVRLNPSDATAKEKLAKLQAELRPSAPPLPAAQPPQQTDPTPAPKPRLSLRRKVGIAVLSAGALALVGSLASGLVTDSARQELLSGSLTLSQARERAQSAETTRGASIGLGVVGGLAAGVGVALILFP